MQRYTEIRLSEKTKKKKFANREKFKNFMATTKIVTHKLSNEQYFI